MQTIIENLTLDDWKNVSILFQGLLMIFLVITGVVQLLAIRAENKKNRTLEICDRHVIDPVLSIASSKLREAFKNGDLARNPEMYEVAILKMGNYFESLAIGVKRRIYDEEIAFDHLQVVLRLYAYRYLLGDFAKRIQIRTNDAVFRYLLDLTKRWEARPDVSIIPKEQLEILVK